MFCDRLDSWEQIPIAQECVHGARRHWWDPGPRVVSQLPTFSGGAGGELGWSETSSSEQGNQDLVLVY